MSHYERIGFSLSISPRSGREGAKYCVAVTLRNCLHLDSHRQLAVECHNPSVIRQSAQHRYQQGGTDERRLGFTVSYDRLSLVLPQDPP